MDTGPDIRIAGLDDLKSIADIYQSAIEAGFETADTKAKEWKESLDWFQQHDPRRHPVFVCCMDGIITGWLSISPYRAGRAALRFTVEISYYVHPEYKRRGIGTRLIEHAITESQKLNYKTLIAIVLDKNENSIRLLKKSGFDQWAFLPRVADFDGVQCSHVYFGLNI